MPFDDLTGTVAQKICMACSREFKGSIGQCPHDGNVLVALPADQWLGRRLQGKYNIRKKIGTGGMGEVYLAWHEMMQAWVAIKFLKLSFLDEPKAIQRFQQEATAAKRLNHANVITLYDFDVAPSGQPYMVMEYLSGYDEAHPAVSFAQLIKQKHAAGNLPVETIIHVISQACDALEHAHRQGVIHRDVKPANIMIVPTEADELFVKVVDFGVAKFMAINNLQEEVQSITTFGEVCGSPVYMSPEQCSGQALDARADIYSMGVVLYEAITGKLPLIGRNMVETMQKHMEEKPKTFNEVRPDLFIPDRLQQVTMRALSKQPHLRQQSMAELAQDLRFAIPRPGAVQAQNLKSIVPSLPEENVDRTPFWLWPSLIAGISVLLIGSFVFLSLRQQTQTQTRTPAVQVAPSPSINTGTTAGTTAATPVNGTDALRRPGIQATINPSSSGSPATTGDVSATIDTMSKATSFVGDHQTAAKAQPKTQVPAKKQKHASEISNYSERLNPHEELKSNLAKVRFNNLKKSYSLNRTLDGD